MVLCLCGICLVCSSLLALVYAVTKKPIEDAAKVKLESAISEVVPAFERLSQKQSLELDGKTYEYYSVSDSTGVLAYAINSSAIGFGGPIKVMVGVQPDGVVYNTAVLSHAETPGLGAKCEDAKFADQFKMFNPLERKLSVKNDGGDIDAITASTITSRAYVVAIETALKVYEAIKIGGVENE